MERYKKTWYDFILKLESEIKNGEEKENIPTIAELDEILKQENNSKLC
jgi:hypothetical protein